ncbi:hypothetical protein [Leptolyngbya sp. PCC 6406]|uniref:hypothetical protein n=1 Tax=Leptolyngbya sp. PCC 6406 TaxID=1173264 RepID=UPI0002AC532B|nr:hypothetical protein [Leptolyngbya sp. PCC 6406]
MDPKEQTLQILLEEYRVLKAEQASRIGFRDNLLYVTLGLFGAISSFALSNSSGHHAFLVIPWVCIVMGWTYVVNDEKISAIGAHIRYTLEGRISALVGGSADNQHLFSWEASHRSDPRRKSRKYLQLFVDEVAFVFSGLTALVVFWLFSTQVSTFAILLSAIEASLLIGLGIKIAIYADLTEGH